VLALTAALALAICLLDAGGALSWLENRSSDLRVKAVTSPPGDPDIVIIDIDNASFRTLTDKLGRWPWTRRVWTELVRYLTPGNPRLILFDVIFSGAEPEADAEFAEVLRAAGNVILPFSFVSGQIETNEDIFTPPASAAANLSTQAPGAVLGRGEWSVNAPHTQLAAAVAGSGVNLWTPDPDGITRRLPLIVRYDGRPWMTFWLAAAQRLRGSAPAAYRGSEFTAGAIRLPVDRNGEYVVQWHGDTLSAYRRVPLWEMICSIYPSQCEPSVKKHAASEFRGKIVFVGASAAGSYEVRPTAISETAPGVFVLATALDNMMHSAGVRRAPEAASFALVFLLAAIPAWGVLARRSISFPLAITAALLAVYAGICFLLYARSLWLPMAAPMLAAAFSFTGSTAYRYLTVDRELSRTRGALERYVSPQLVRYVMEHLASFRFDGERKRLTVLFSDIRGFTTLTEKSDPAELVRQLNEYLEAMTDIIFKYDGIVDKFIGDGIMAHWGAFTPGRPNALLAAQASLDMIRKLGELNALWATAGKPQLDIGIGLNTADVIFGNIGTGKKTDFTCIGDGVNLASRLEGANKEFHTRIIISDYTRRELGDHAVTRPLGSVVVKGKTEPVDIFELQGLTERIALEATGNFS
jgi:adenylate cyclase